MVKVPGYATVEEIAKATGLSESAVRWHCRTGRLSKAAVPTQAIWLIPKAAADAFVRAYTARRDGTSNGDGRP